MTICIAAIYGNGEGSVLVSDRMVTAHFPIGYEFEHQEDTKIIALYGKNATHIMIAGDVLLGNEVLNVARDEITQCDADIPASKVGEIVRQAYQKVRLTKIVHQELEPRGLNLSSYHDMQQRLSPQIVQMVDQAMHNVDLGVQMLVAGPSSGRHTIHSIANPGVVNDHTPIGYGCIGSGSPHAMYSLIEGSYRKSMSKKEVTDLVNEAKERSEVAPGVGVETTFVEIPDGENEGNDHQPK